MPRIIRKHDYGFVHYREPEPIIVTWDAETLGGSTTLDETALIATFTDDGTAKGVLATLPRSTGKWFFTTTFLAGAVNGWGCGLVPAGTTPEHPFTQGFSLNQPLSGALQILVDNVLVATTLWDNQNTHCVAWDADAGTVYFGIIIEGVSTSITWRNGNPNGGDGSHGPPITGVSGELYPALSFKAGSFTGSDFRRSGQFTRADWSAAVTNLPAEYLAWDGT